MSHYSHHTCYTRVIPRDLFNESKLLKCLGQLALLIHDGKAPPQLVLVHDDQEYAGFNVEQNMDDAGLVVTNLYLTYKQNKIDLRSVYNSKSPYPLLYVTRDECVGDVFNDDGSLADEFLAYLKSV